MAGNNRWFVVLLFWCFLCYLIARRLEVAHRKGGHFIRGMKKGQSIFDYGIYNTVTSFALGNPRRDTPDTTRRWMGVTFFVMVLLHIYLTIIIALKHIWPSGTNYYIQSVTEPFIALLHYWPSFRLTAEKMMIHGYGQRVPIVAHSYLLSH